MKRIALYIPVLALLSIVFMTYANRVDDFDLWWHLKQGQLIYETRAIPQHDDFSYTTEMKESINAPRTHGMNQTSSTDTKRYWSTSIKRNWLSQLIFYLVYLAGGFIGIGIFKSVMFAATYLVLYVTMVKRGADHLISFLVLCLIAFIGIDFNFTRSQIFSFLLFPCVLYILYDFKKGGKSFYFLPVLMILWANIHGGFILGDFIILSFCFMELLKYSLKNKLALPIDSSLPVKRLKVLFFFSLTAIVGSLLNPNGYKPFLFPFMQEQSIFRTIEEYHRPMLYEYHAYWFMLAIMVVLIVISIRKRRLDFSELGFLLIVTLPSLESIRYIIFFALGSGVFIAYALSYNITQLKEWSPMKRFLNWPGFRKGILSVLFSILSIFICIAIVKSGKVLQFDLGDRRYPAGSVSFIQENKPAGNLFNPYNWGGYLIWRLYPAYKVFIYGRTLNETTFIHCRQILSAEQGMHSPIPVWKRLLDFYNINFILTSAVSSEGTIYNLVDKLYTNDEWKLVHADGRSMIFLRNIPANIPLINRYELPKEKIHDEIIDECKQGIKDSPATWGYYETLGYIYMKKNRLQEALMMFEKYLSMNPNNEPLRYYRDLLKKYLKMYNKNQGH